MHKYIEHTTVIRGRKFFNLKQARLSIKGPVKVGIILWPNSAIVSWCWYGSRFSKVLARDISTRGRRWLVCPHCRKWRYNLYVDPEQGENGIGCRGCLGLTYRQWYEDRGQPKDPVAWADWLYRKLQRYENQKV